MNLVCKRLQIEAPILQAPIGSASCPELVAAVSNAGGLGMLAATWLSPENLCEAVLEIRRRTTRAFAINLGVHADPAEKIDVCLKLKAPIISLFWGDAREYFAQIKSGGASVIATIGTTAEATAAAEAGADAIIAQGFEAGGHVWGKVNTLALVSAVAEKIRDVPIIAAGGIGDGRTMANAMAAGASGVCLGTRFIVATESMAHPEYREKILQSGGDDTFYGEVFTEGWPNAPHRVLRTGIVNEFIRVGRVREGETVAVGIDGKPITRYSSRLPVRGMSGNIESMALYAGTSVSLCKKIQPASGIVAELMSETSRFL